MKHLTKRLLVLITSVLLVAIALSSCGLDSVETNEVSDEARQKFIESMIYAEGAELLYTPTIEEYYKQPANYDTVNKSSGGQTGLTGFSKILSNDKYELYINFKTTDVAVVDLATGFAYHSNPANDPDTSLSESQQASVGSPLSVEAYDASGKRYSFDFYKNCYDEGSGAFYVVKTGDSSIRLIYTIGNDPDKDLFPPVITKDTYENRILKGLDNLLATSAITQDQWNTYQKLLDNCYRYITPNPEDETQRLKPEDQERFKETFPTIDVMSLYISYDKTSTKRKSQIKELMESIGFTVKDVKAEMEKADYQGPERSVLYTIPVDLSLNDDGLSINIDSSKILGPTKQRLYTINVYRGFGARSFKEEDRHIPYMIVPDGSGAVIPYAGNLSNSVFKSRIYGSDGSFDREYSVDYSEQVLVPYLILDRGVLRENATRLNAGGVIAIMEDGAAQSSAIARPYAGTSNPLCSVNYEVIYSERDYRTYSTSTAITAGSDAQSGSGLLLSKDDVTGNYTIQYIFTEGGLSYSEYAARLRAYFMKKELFPSEPLTETELPLFIDLIGCVDLNQTVMGIPVKTETALTTYKQALEIYTKLKENGVNNVVARYSYWANGGENNFSAKDLELLSCMGTEAELEALVQYCNENDLGFFPSVEFLHVTSAANGFSKSQDAARRMNRSTATIVERMNAVGALRYDLDEKILVSSKVSLEMAESYKASFEAVVNSKSIALGTLGDSLHSNYRTKDGVTRSWAEKDHVQLLKTFAGYDIAVSTGNFYTWNYASHIFSMPSGSSEYLSESSAIPFLQIMLHGYVNYSLEPLNFTGDYETALLLALETGSAFTFRWMGAEDSIFDYTAFYNYFSLNYNATFDRALAIYKEAASVLNDVVNETITDHVELDAYYVLDHEGLIGWLEPVPDETTGEIPKDADGNIIYQAEAKRISCGGGVFATVYGEKKVVIVNYNSNDVELNDRTVMEAKSYKVLTLEEYESILNGSAYEPLPEAPADPVEDDTVQEG